MKLQLVGPMTDHCDYNRSAFMAAAELLRDQGHQVFNPAESFGGDTSLPREHYMRACIGALLGAEAVVTLVGWETSRGATLEVEVARELGLKVHALAEFSR